MDKLKTMRWRIFATISGYTEQEATQGLPNFLAELALRTYLLQPTAYWNAKTENIAVTLEIEDPQSDPNEDFAKGFAYDEIFESVVAWIDFSSKEGIRVIIVGAEPVQV